jgi:acyl dehydratase
MLGGPYFEDLAVGQVFDDAPALTLTEGHAAVHQALVGDRLRLALDATLSREVTGEARPLAHPNLVCDVAIGQTTGPSQRVRGNLFYRGLVLLRPVFIGDTLRTRTEIVGLKQNRPREGAPATGLVALRMQTENQHGERVLDFWRCPMLPLRDPAARTGHADGFDDIPEQLDPARVAAAVPTGWRLNRFAERVPGPRAAELRPGAAVVLEDRETVTCETELARLTLNVAYTHTDAGRGAHTGRRLAYGGHTIAIAAAHVTRILPSLVTILAWHGCDHTGPVFAGDILSTELQIGEVRPAGDGAGALADLRAVVRADRSTGAAPDAVLDWRFIGLVA